MRGDPYATLAPSCRYFLLNLSLGVKILEIVTHATRPLVHPGAPGSVGRRPGAPLYLHLNPIPEFG